METDSLLSARTETSPGNEKNSEVKRRQILSRWALVVAVSFLAVALIVDIRLRVAAGNDEARSTSTATDTYHETASSPLSTSSTPPRYHATQFISFTINTLGGLAEYGECEGRKVDPNSNSCYLGSDDIESDVNHRLAILEEVLSTLR